MNRGSGILLHITSLPSPYGIGDLGADAYRFVDFLAETHQSVWQILPLTSTSPSYGNSPYSSHSALAGNTLLISPERMLKNGLLSEDDMEDVPAFPEGRVDYGAVTAFKNRIFDRAFKRHRDRLASHQDFQRFCAENEHWLDDYTLFMSIKNHHDDKEWAKWPMELRDRDEHALKKTAQALNSEILREKFLQYIFFTQWHALKNYCDSKDIKIMGDIPIYVNYDSADVWANPAIFSLDERREPLYVAGVPPDYFSTTGQLWGHPVYRWDVLRKSDYAWWIGRIAHNLDLYHLFRLDHFRGFVGYWQVHSSETTAINGKWVEAPADDFFTTVLQRFPDITIIAEDLGTITPDVKEVMTRFGFPGMKVLLFAFGDDLPTNPYVPHNHVKNCVIYTGTHDNNTIRGWYHTELRDQDRKRLAEYIGRELSDRNIHWEIIRLALMSVADLAIVPMQDMLGLGQDARMNLPATVEGNWEWRLRADQITPSFRKKLAEATKIYGRAIKAEELLF